MKNRPEERLPLKESEAYYIKRMRWDIRLNKIQIAAIVLFFLVFVTTEWALLKIADRNSHYLSTLVCASDIRATNCPPPDAKTKALAEQLKAAQDRRDAVLIKKITVPLEQKIQELLNRPTQTKVVTTQGPTRTIVITRTRTVTVCRTPSGKPC